MKILLLVSYHLHGQYMFNHQTKLENFLFLRRSLRFNQKNSCEEDKDASFGETVYMIKRPRLRKLKDQIVLIIKHIS